MWSLREYLQPLDADRCVSSRVQVMTRGLREHLIDASLHGSDEVDQTLIWGFADNDSLDINPRGLSYIVLKRVVILVTHLSSSLGGSNMTCGDFSLVDSAKAYIYLTVKDVGMGSPNCVGSQLALVACARSETEHLLS